MKNKKLIVGLAVLLVVILVIAAIIITKRLSKSGEVNYEKVLESLTATSTKPRLSQEEVGKVLESLTPPTSTEQRLSPEEVNKILESLTPPKK